jgi:hypothetical protein
LKMRKCFGERTVNWIKLPNIHEQIKTCSFGVVYWNRLRLPPKETGAMGREIESRQGICGSFLEKKIKKHLYI